MSGHRCKKCGSWHNSPVIRVCLLRRSHSRCSVCCSHEANSCQNLSLTKSQFTCSPTHKTRPQIPQSSPPAEALGGHAPAVAEAHGLDEDGAERGRAEAQVLAFRQDPSRSRNIHCYVTSHLAFLASGALGSSRTQPTGSAPSWERAGRPRAEIRSVRAHAKSKRKQSQRQS